MWELMGFGQGDLLSFVHWELVLSGATLGDPEFRHGRDSCLAQHWPCPLPGCRTTVALQSRASKRLQGHHHLCVLLQALGAHPQNLPGMFMII